MKLLGKVALITGGSKGIGKSISLEMAKEGAMIAITYSKDDDMAERTLKEIRALGGSAIALKGDTSDFDRAKEIVDEVVLKYGKIDILVNNAGISSMGLLMDMSEGDWDRVIGVNLKGVFNYSRHAMYEMLKQGEGSIINISSIWGNVGAACEVAYSASKGGINMFTKALAKEMAPSNIRVNAISPGVINTEMNSWLKEDEKAELENDIPMGSFGEGEDIGRLAVFLASKDSKYITSQIITVDGGLL